MNIPKKTSLITPSVAVAGIANGTNGTEEYVEDINPISINTDRAKYELKAAKLRNGLDLRENNPFEEFAKAKNEYPNYMDFAELLSSKLCITFSSPKMTMAKLPFEAHPMITGVTFKAITEG